MSTPRIELLNVDCCELLPFAPECTTLICDPPYSAHVHASATSVSTSGARAAQGKGVEVRDLGFAHLSRKLRTDIAIFAALVRRWSLVYSDVESAHEWREALLTTGCEYIRTLPWVRWSQPQLSGDRPPTGWEAITIAHHATPKKRGGIKPVAKHWNGYGELVGLDHKALRGAGKNKAEKPLDQLLDLVSWFSDEEEVVADLTAGRGTTALACRILRRGFLGAELDAAEHARACERVHGPQLSARDAERVLRFVERVNAEAPVDPKFPPSVRRQRARQKDAARALRYLNKHAP